MKANKKNCIYYRFAHEKTDIYKTLELDKNSVSTENVKFLIAQATGLEKEFGRAFDLKLFLQTSNGSQIVEQNDLMTGSHIIVQRVAWREKPNIEHVIKSDEMEKTSLLRPFPPEYVCPLCHNILTFPVVVRCVGKCGLSACRACVKEKLLHEDSCPFCSSRVLNIIANKALSNIIGKLHLNEFQLPLESVERDSKTESVSPTNVKTEAAPRISKGHTEESCTVPKLPLQTPCEKNEELPANQNNSTSFTENQTGTFRDTSFTEPLKKNQHDMIKKELQPTTSFEKILGVAKPYLINLSSTLAKLGSQGNHTTLQETGSSDHETLMKKNTFLKETSLLSNKKPVPSITKPSHYQFDNATNSWKSIHSNTLSSNQCPTIHCLSQLTCKFPHLCKKDFYILRKFQKELFHALYASQNSSVNIHSKKIKETNDVSSYDVTKKKYSATHNAHYVMNQNRSIPYPLYYNSNCYQVPYPNNALRHSYFPKPYSNVHPSSFLT
jgi:hypothetical protein